jgi:putative CocE/NonD family hydrolase
MSSGSAVGDLGPFHEQGLFYRGGAIQLAWGGWFAALGQRDFPKFPPGITLANRDSLASTALAGHWMEDLSALASKPTDLTALPIAGIGDAPGGQATDWDDFVRRKPNDPAWGAMHLLQGNDKIGVPALWVMSAHDLGVGPQLAAFEHAIGAGAVKGIGEEQRAIITPLGHCSAQTETEQTLDGERLIGDARFPYLDVFTAWFDQRLRDAPSVATPLPRMQVYLPGADHWEQFDAWPPRSASTRFYLSSGHGANTRQGDGHLLRTRPVRTGLDKFTYDPVDPVPTVGGDVLLSGPPGSFDHATVENRKDVLVYTSEPLASALTAIGMVDVQLEVSSDAPDTDFTANLLDVAPDGKAYVLNGSIQRARWRNGYDREVPMLPGQVYRLRVGPFFVSNRFLPGHRIALEVSSSSVPRYERNMNTGGANFDEARGRPAMNSVHLGGDRASFLTIPLLNDASMKRAAPFH